MQHTSAETSPSAILSELRKKAFTPVSQWLHIRSCSLVAFLDSKIERLIVGWIFVTVLLGLVKLASSPMPLTGFGAVVSTLLPYLLVSMAPIAGYRIAAGCFPRSYLSAQPQFRLCRIGTWRKVDPISARGSPSFGPTGFMASLLVGILLNVPVRTLEFALAIPAIAPGAPGWAHTLFLAMTFDVIVMNFFYAVCFVMAIRTVSIFPRMLLFTWTIDIVTQFAIAHQVSMQSNLPGSVSGALHDLLNGNIQKVLVSALVWLPYLILSDRVNVTFRQRVPTARTTGL